MGHDVKILDLVACLPALVYSLRYLFNWITLDPGDVVIQALEPFNICDVLIARNETFRPLSALICFLVSVGLEAAACFLPLAGRLFGPLREGDAAFEQCGGCEQGFICSSSHSQKLCPRGLPLMGEGG